MKIVLIGYRGSGKTTLGKHLASQLNIPFIDTDHLVEIKTKMTIPEIFSREGEAGFRLQETLVLREVLQLENAVISTGGGIILLSENRLLIRGADLVVYLTAPFHVLAERTKNDPNRPPLTDLSHEDEILSLLKKRIPLYEELADVTIDTSSFTIEEAANIILKKIQKETPCKDSLCY